MNNTDKITEYRFSVFERRNGQDIYLGKVYLDSEEAQYQGLNFLRLSMPDRRVSVENVDETGCWSILIH